VEAVPFVGQILLLKSDVKSDVLVTRHDTAHTGPVAVKTAWLACAAVVRTMRLSRLLVAAGARPPAAAARAPPLLRRAPVTAAAAGAARFGALAAVPLVLPTSWLSTRGLHGTAVASTGARGPPAARSAVLVKVGSGLFSLAKIPKATGMDRMSLLEALAESKAFAASLTGVALDKCAVRVCVSASKKAPTAAEEAAARELEGAETLGDLAAGLAGASPGAGATNLFVRVDLPPASVSGTGALDLSAERECTRAAVGAPYPLARAS
jgi:hypothetical protein